MKEASPAQPQLIGLLGGMSWESSALYYRLLNEGMHRELGGHHNARSVLFTIDFHELNAAASAGRWDRVGEVIADAARRVERAGADFVMITAVTGHAVADQVEAALSIPLLHIADPVAETLKQSGISRIGLLGTRYTMNISSAGSASAPTSILPAMPVPMPTISHSRPMEKLVYRPTPRLSASAFVQGIGADAASGMPTYGVTFGLTF